MVKNKQEQKKVSSFKMKWKALCFLNLESPVEDIKKAFVFRKSSKKNHSLNLYHVKFWQNRHISWCFESPSGSEKLRILKHHLVQLQSHILLPNSVNFQTQIAEYLEIRRRQALSWKWLSTVLQPGCAKPTHSLHSWTHQLRILCWAKYETFSQHQHLISFLSHYIFPFYIRQLKNDQ